MATTNEDVECVAKDTVEFVRTFGFDIGLINGDITVFQIKFLEAQSVPLIYTESYMYLMNKIYDGQREYTQKMYESLVKDHKEQLNAKNN